MVPILSFGEREGGSPATHYNYLGLNTWDVQLTHDLDLEPLVSSKGGKT